MSRVVVDIECERSPVPRLRAPQTPFRTPTGLTRYDRRLPPITT
jgi:hypothetical protein